MHWKRSARTILRRWNENTSFAFCRRRTACCQERMGRRAGSGSSARRCSRCSNGLESNCRTIGARAGRLVRVSSVRVSLAGNSVVDDESKFPPSRKMREKGGGVGHLRGFVRSATDGAGVQSRNRCDVFGGKRYGRLEESAGGWLNRCGGNFDHKEEISGGRAGDGGWPGVAGSGVSGEVRKGTPVVAGLF